VLGGREECVAALRGCGRLAAGSGCWRGAEGSEHLLPGADHVPGQHRCSCWGHLRGSVSLP